MGKEVDPLEFTREDRTRYREKVRANLDALTRMLAGTPFECDRPLTGLEIELNLVDDRAAPAMRNAAVLEAIADPAFVTELGQWNIEINVPPEVLEGDGLARVEDRVRASLNAAEEHAAGVGAHTVMIGILPTLRQEQLHHDVLSANPRYSLLNQQILAARGEDLYLEIDGVERLVARYDSIAPEAACTSVQFHLQVAPEDFAAYWNAAQCLAGVQLATAANSPYLFGRQLWCETRIPLFEQATDTRSEELKAQGVRPRVWFGERYIDSIYDLFDENVRYFPSLLPIVDEENPLEVLDAGAVPKLSELTLHNGTVYRWNRPVYAVVDGRPHLRVENRVLPAGPTVADIMANAAFYFGLVRAMAEADRPMWTQMSFSAAEENFRIGARYGIDSMLYWPGLGAVPATELVLRRLLPMAAEGLDRWGMAARHRERLLGIIGERCRTGRNGASWQVAAAARHEGSLAAMLGEYRERMHSNIPVHEWPT